MRLRSTVSTRPSGRRVRILSRVEVLVQSLICVLVGGAIGCIAIGDKVATTIPPKNLTQTRLAITRNRLERYWNEHGAVPTLASQLPQIANRDCSMVDGWGNPFSWESNGRDEVRVLSRGKDRWPGGSGDNADLEMIFQAHAMNQ